MISLWVMSRVMSLIRVSYVSLGRLGWASLAIIWRSRLWCWYPYIRETWRIHFLGGYIRETWLIHIREWSSGVQGCGAETWLLSWGAGIAAARHQLHMALSTAAKQEAAAQHSPATTHTTQPLPTALSHHRTALWCTVSHSDATPRVSQSWTGAL